MKIKFKTQAYQTNAVESVVDCFAGQVNTAGIQYRIDPGRVAMGQTKDIAIEGEYGFKNAKLQLTEQRLLENIHTVQRLQNLSLSSKLISSAGCKVNLDIEMETGTGKTYCYIKTII
jgi:type III restriction enzyme